MIIEADDEKHHPCLERRSEPSPKLKYETNTRVTCGVAFSSLLEVSTGALLLQTSDGTRSSR